MLISLTRVDTGETIKLEAESIAFCTAITAGSLVQYDNSGGNLASVEVTEIPSAVATATGGMLFAATTYAPPFNISASVPFDNGNGTFLFGERVNILKVGYGVCGAQVTTPLTLSNYQGGNPPDNQGIQGTLSNATALVNGSVTFTYNNGVSNYINASRILSAQASGIAALTAIDYRQGFSKPGVIYTSLTPAQVLTAANAVAYAYLGASQTFSGNNTFSGTTTFSGVVLNTGVQALTGAGAANLTTRRTNVTSTGADVVTLANGSVGQQKVIAHIVDGGSVIVTPATALGFTTATLASVGGTVTLEYGTGGWAVIGSNGCVVA